MLSMPEFVFDILKLVEAVPGVTFMLLQIVVEGTDGAYSCPVALLLYCLY